MKEIKGLKGFVGYSEVIYGVREEVLTDKEMKKLKSVMNGRPVFVQNKKLETFPELEALGFVRLEDRIKDPLFFAFDRPDMNRKNLYVLEETTDYIDERVKAFIPLLPILKTIDALDPNLNIRGYLRKDTPIFHETMNFYRNGFFLPEKTGDYYYFEAHENEFGKRLEDRQDVVKENELDFVLHRLFKTFIRE